MQRHKKYLIITIWISTIAFVGAGFVGWGQYSYGDKAGAVAKVGNVEITIGELQKSYSGLYAQYSQMFRGDFDDEKAKNFGLKSQALQYLINQALILNLAASYDLRVSENELLEDIKTKDYFFKDGVFNKEIYKDVLSKNKLSIKEYEDDLKKELLIKKTLNLIPIVANENELKVANILENVADKIKYKVLKLDSITVDSSDILLKPYWEKIQKNFISEVSYDVKFIKQEKLSKEFTQAEIETFYSENKTQFKDAEGKILSLDDAKAKIQDEMILKESKKEALKAYIAYKKGEIENQKIQEATLSESNNPFNRDAYDAVSKLTPESPFSKPILIGEEYFTFNLIKVNPSKVKSFEDAKSSVLPLYLKEQKQEKLLELAKNSASTFEGTQTDFITGNDAAALSKLDKNEANEFLSGLFTSQNKRGFIKLESGNIVLYNILEQKLLDINNNNQADQIAKLKGNMFNEGLIKNLQSKYKTEIFIEGF